MTCLLTTSLTAIWALVNYLLQVGISRAGHDGIPYLTEGQARRLRIVPVWGPNLNCAGPIPESGGFRTNCIVIITLERRYLAINFRILRTASSAGRRLGSDYRKTR